MGRHKLIIKFVLIYIVLISLIPQSIPLGAQDLVPSDSVSGGSSVFVFRESRKKPQAHFASSYAFLGEGGDGRKSVAKRSNARVVIAAKKRRAAAALARKKAIAAAANRKLALSNTLTAKAETSLDADNFDAAITDFRSALVQNPKNERAKLGLSEALTEKGIQVAGDENKQAAIPFLDEAITLDNNDAAAYGKLGAIYDTAGDNEKAAVNYQKAIALDKEFVGLNAPLGLIYIELGEVAKAEECLHAADLAGIDTIESRNLRGLILYKRNLNVEALAAFDRSLQLDGRNVLANFYRGQINTRLDKPADSMVAYRKTLELEPTFAPASFELGVAYYNAGDYNDAATAYRETIKNDPGNSQAHANLASTYRQLERYPEANAEYKAASEGIKSPDLYSEWGYCLGKVDDWNASADRLITAHELSPTAIDSSNVGWAYYNAAQSDKAGNNEAEAKAKLEKAKPYLLQAVEKDPKFDAAYLNLGSTYNGLGEFQLAIAALDTAVNLRQNWIIAINQLGISYRGLRDLNTAISTFQRAVDLDGNYSYGLYNLGEALYANGNKKDAKKVSERLKKVDPVLGTRLDGIISGKIVVDKAEDKIKSKIPRIPRIPY